MNTSQIIYTALRTGNESLVRLAVEETASEWQQAEHGTAECEVVYAAALNDGSDES